MKNFQKLALGLIVGAMAIGFSAFTNVNANNLITTYRYNAGEQAWSPSGGLPADQNASHYSAVTGTPVCASSTNICTYDLVNGKFEQSAEGTLQ